MEKLASKTLNTILSLQDNASKKLVGVSNNFKTLSKEAQKATLSAQKSLNNLGNGIEKTVTNTVSKVAKIGTVLGALAVGSGLSEAMDLEGYRVQLETATKSTEKTTELMKNAIDFANKTPFETGEVVQATAKMEMYGLSSTRWLSDIADMAGSTNKSIDQATEAMADVAVGEFERIKEFGLKKDMILAASNKKYGEGVVINAKGQVIDQAKLMDTIQEMMKEKFGGGAEKLSKTTKGMWSTITGITKNSLAKIVGIGEDGQVKTGTLLDKIRTKIQQVGDKLTEWQSNGTIDKISQKFSDVFSKIYDVISKVINFIVQNKDIIITIASMAIAFTLVSKAIRGLSVATKAFQLIWAILNGTILLTPVGWIIIGITALVGAFVLAYQKSETFRNMINSLWSKIQELGAQLMDWANSTIVPIIQQIGQSLSDLWNNVISPFLSWLVGVLQPIFAGVWETLVQFVTGAFTAIGEVIEGGLKIIQGIIDFVTGVFSGDWEKAWNGIKETFSGIVDGIKGIWDGLVTWLSAPVNAVVNITKHIFGGGEDATQTDVAKNALGTNYFRGGTTLIGEHGPELLTLPRGSKINTNSQSQNILNNNDNIPPIQISINTFIGEESFADRCGEIIAGKIKLALANM